MKRKLIPVCLGLLAGIAAGCLGEAGRASLLTALFAPWQALGALLRRWSESGNAGNAAAWALILVLSLLPTLLFLPFRRKEKRKGDFLFPAVSVLSVACLFLLVNPFLLLPDGMPEEMKLFSSSSPVILLLSALLCAVLVRWSGGLKDAAAARWLRALIVCGMALIALSAGWTLAEACRPLAEAPEADPLAGLFGAGAPSASVRLASSLPALLSLAPDFFLLRMLSAAHRLASAFSEGLFTAGTRSASALLAARARHSLTASVGWLAAGNLLQLATARLTGSLSVSLQLPLFEMALSCGAMLLARLLSAALRIQRDNDLMI